jgi:hypothetical protein
MPQSEEKDSMQQDANMPTHAFWCPTKRKQGDVKAYEVKVCPGCGLEAGVCKFTLFPAGYVVAG